MSNLHEILNSLKNEENADQIAEAIKVADAQHKGNKQLYSRAKKAEGFEDKNGEWVKKEKPEPKKKEPEAKQPDEPDYSKTLEIAQRALLNSSGFKAQEQQDYIFKEAKRLKVDVSEIVSDEFHQQKLKAIADKIDVQGGMPKGGGKGGGGASDSVEYWLAKGETPDDQELAEKVIEAKMKKEGDKSMFADQTFIG